MKKVAITGSKGTIGTVLMKGIKGCELISIDLPETDALDIKAFKKKICGCDVLIHLAWKYANPDSSEFLDSVKMFANAYEAALEMHVKRIIVASSVHAGDGTPYGEQKSQMESLGKEYASKYPIEVIVIRFGGVNKEDKILENEKNYEKIYLRHKDCVAVVDKCIKKEIVSNRFEIITAVSNTC